MKRVLAPAALALAAVVVIAASGSAAPAASSGAAATQDTLRLSLDEALTLAQRGSAEMRVALQAVQVAEGQVKEAAAAALPQITGSLTYNRKFDSVFQNAAQDTSLGGLSDLFRNTSFAAEHSWTADLTATQMLWSSGRVGAGLSAARAYRTAVRADRDETWADVALQIKQAYYDALYTRDVQAIAESGLQLARQQLEQVRKLRQQGSRAEYDLLQAQVDAANQEPPVVEARNAAALALLTLKRRLGLALEQPIALTTPLAFGDAVPVVANEPSDAARRAALTSAEATVQARRQALRAERSLRWPTLSAQATVSHAAFPADGSPELDEFTRGIDGSIKLEWPLFQGFRTFGAVQRATGELRQAEARRDLTRQSVALDLEYSRQELHRSLSTLAARRGTVALARRTHELASVRYQNGLSTALEVSDARLKLQTAEVNAVAALKDYRLSLARLERASGGPLAMTTTSLDAIPTIVPNDEVNR